MIRQLRHELISHTARKMEYRGFIKPKEPPVIYSYLYRN